MAGPLVTIVTPTYNMVRFLPEAVESVLSQGYPHIEYIVADGGSTDGTLDLLPRWKSRLRWFSGADRGPCDAVHRAFSQAGGEVFAWLNADDRYLPGAVSAAVRYLESHPEIDVVYGNARWIDESGTVIGAYPTLPFDSRVLSRDCFICQPAAFLRASSYRLCSLDPAVIRSFDYDLWIRMDKRHMRFAHIPECLAQSRMHPGAKTLSERGQVFHASIDILRRHYGYVPLNWVVAQTAYVADGRDQFFEPLELSFRTYLATLRAGLGLNPANRLRFMAEWLSTPWAALRRRMFA